MPADQDLITLLKEAAGSQRRGVTGGADVQGEGHLWPRRGSHLAPRFKGRVMPCERQVGRWRRVLRPPEREAPDTRLLRS